MHCGHERLTAPAAGEGGGGSWLPELLGRRMTRRRLLRLAPEDDDAVASFLCAVRV